VAARENRGVGMKNCQVQERGTSIYRHGLGLGLFSGPIELERGLAQNPKSGRAKLFPGIKMLLRISSVLRQSELVLGRTERRIIRTRNLICLASLEK
jgi:hypothetical protein